MQLLLATTNAGKIREFVTLFANVPGLELLTPTDVGGIVDVDEDGTTFADNAEKKARAQATAFGTDPIPGSNCHAAGLQTKYFAVIFLLLNYEMGNLLGFF